MSYLDKCTQGEWYAEHDGDYCTSITVDKKFVLAEVYGDKDSINSANLMAESKKMYEALEDSIETMKYILPDCEQLMPRHSVEFLKESINKAKSAMKAARGEK